MFIQGEVRPLAPLYTYFVQTMEPRERVELSIPPYQGGGLPLTYRGILELLQTHWSLSSDSNRYTILTRDGCCRRTPRGIGAGDGNRTHEFWLEARHVTTSITPAWSGIRESNPCSKLGKLIRYHYNNPANWCPAPDVNWSSDFRDVSRVAGPPAHTERGAGTENRTRATDLASQFATTTTYPQIV